MKTKRRLTQILLYFMSGVFLTVVIFGVFLWINYQKNQSRWDSQKMATEFRTRWEETIKKETQAIAGHIESRTSEGSLAFYQEVKKRAEAMGAALKAKTSKEVLADRDLIFAVLGAFLDDSGRTRYLALDFKARVLTRSLASETFTHDPTARAIVASVLELGEAFYRFDFDQSWPDQEEKPVVYLKVDPSLELIVGAASLFSEFQASIKNEVLAWAKAAPISGQLLILDYSGQVLASPIESQVGQNIFVDQGDLFAKAAARILRGARSQSSGFLDFDFQDSNGQTQKALGYFRSIEAWRWVAVTYVDLSQLAAALTDEQENLANKVRGQIAYALLIATLMLGMIAILGHFISKKAQKSFQEFYSFFESASLSSVEIDPDSQPFIEFSLLARSVNRMIAQRREANQFLAASEAKYRSVFDYSPLLIVITDALGRVVEANQEFANFVEREPAEFLGQDLRSYFFIDQDFRERIKAEVMDKGVLRNLAIEIPKGSGEVVPMLFTSKILVMSGEKFFLSLFVDITALRESENERLRLQEKLARSQKMEAMGLLAAQVAHELNNILSGLVGYPELLIRDDSLGPSQKELAQEIKEAGLRAAAVVSDLLTLAQGLATTRVPVDFGQLVEACCQTPEIKALLNRQKKPINLTVAIAKPNLEVLGSAVHLRKIAANIVQNAIEAVGVDPDPTPGEVKVAVDQVFLNEPVGGLENFKPGPFILLSIKDNGPGLNPADLGRIFEPFYSRKTGTGLGLAVVAIVAKEHGGAVAAGRLDPKGAEFLVWLPLLAGLKANKFKSLESYQGQGQKILVVDDVDIQRKLAQKMLKSLGYETHSVASGEEAVEYLKTHEADLVILDMIMRPGLNGRETYEAILAFKPGQKAIIASGLAEGEEVAKAQALGARYFVAKPYTLEDIAGAVHSAITGQ
ncbi:MAG: response regulator [Deltaproteobacteria bacterium]|jgi:PAS domain S-box-containing protein|nr:response regulator [Deltaproteobacteria bacterium]